MDLKEQILKLEEKLFKVREKKKKIMEEEKELLGKLTLARKKKEEEDNRKLATMVEEQLGEMSESKLQALKYLLSQHADEFVSEEEILVGAESGNSADFADQKSVMEENFSEERQIFSENNPENSRKGEVERGGYHWQGIGDS